MDILVLLILIIGIIFVAISWFKNEIHCPPPQVIYKYIPANVIDTQFSKENLPSNLYTDMFNNDNVWIGGMSMSIGKTVAASSKPVSQPYMSMTPTPAISPANTGPLVK
jgi:hypothetical protein